MRPVERGDPPAVFTNYQAARPWLKCRIGWCCSYCERPVSHHAHLEHVVPQAWAEKHDPGLALAWTNFLLACDNCNSHKRNRLGANHPGDAYYWPDRDNTARAFEYRPTGEVVPSPSLPPAEAAKALRSRDLTQLNLNPNHDSQGKDERWRLRLEAWGVAHEALGDLGSRDSADLRKWILKRAVSGGFFSVWMTVFDGHPDMRRGFIEAFPGTARDCFDDQCKPVPRPGGAL